MKVWISSGGFFVALMFLSSCGQDNGAPGRLSPSVGAQDEVEPPDFVAVDVPPTPTKRGTPEYPEEALSQGLEGHVWIKVWVTKHGNVRKAEVIKSSNTVFDQAALKAAREFEFTPAMLGGKPVDVWVSIPFRFKRSSKE
jgi:TonB family protein